MPLPVIGAVELTVVKPASSCATHDVPFHFNICPNVALCDDNVGFGYVPDKSPPAAPPGNVPVIVVLPADVNLPCASTVNIGTSVAVP